MKNSTHIHSFPEKQVEDGYPVVVTNGSLEAALHTAMQLLRDRYAVRDIIPLHAPPGMLPGMRQIADLFREAGSDRFIKERHTGSIRHALVAAGFRDVEVTRWRDRFSSPGVFKVMRDRAISGFIVNIDMQFGTQTIPVWFHIGNLADIRARMSNIFTLLRMQMLQTQNAKPL